MNSQQLQVLLKNIQDMMKCPSCGASYGSGQIHFLGQMEATCLVQLDCLDCGLPVLAHFIVSDLYNVGSRVVSDLSEVDLKKFMDMEPIQNDELIQAHEALTSFSGDLGELFRR
jgi:hypothetical protein